MRQSGHRDGEGDLPVRRSVGLRRSVAAYYTGDLRQFAAIDDPAATARLKASQKDWLVSRDRCAADADCLRRSMAARLGALADTARFTG